MTSSNRPDTLVTCPDCAATVDAAVLVASCEYIEPHDEPDQFAISAVIPRPVDLTWHLESCPTRIEALKVAAIDFNWTGIDPQQLRVRPMTALEKLIVSVLANRTVDRDWTTLAQVRRVNDQILVALAAHTWLAPRQEIRR